MLTNMMNTMNILNILTEINLQKLLRNATPHEVQTLPQKEVVQLVKDRIAHRQSLDGLAEREAVALGKANVFRSRQRIRPRRNMVRNQRVGHVLLNR